jgi:hypothetical protein
MKPQPESSTQEVLAGLIERVTYHNPENGFCVLRAKARGHRDVVTVVGHAATIAAGEWVTASGEWVNDRTHGQQFKARFLRTSPPTSADGIEKYLSSGMIRGVGPVYAKKLVRAFGEKVFDIIETAPDRLREVDGIGPVRAASILAAWAEQKDREPLSLGARYPRYRLQDCRRHRREARYRKDGDDPGSRRDFLCADRRHGRGPLRPADGRVGAPGREAARRATAIGSNEYFDRG